ncbi:MAG: insulinase family protein [Rhodocyclaceae bacterium]|nr:insulinase family protein [Rhodocyclaceae bacterium]MCA3024671.1 insulinase family protein [Rhodocyclaceae bacterium]MCA3031684.1 insulinase family protein [Rhodocyclaceae bacterium]MCA3037464.1 insulinase family protein [Rhodocyclaceae bacterium]MCA3047570.1 insulinase family protein [Rhodocyclaceae bacterium]
MSAKRSLKRLFVAPSALALVSALAVSAVWAQKVEPSATAVGKPAAKAAAPSTAKPPVAANKPVVPEKVASVEGITEYRLPNGMKVLLYPDQSKPTVTVNITYLVGSKHENYGETGMAHLLEHLLFKGTPKNPDIAQQHNKRGMRWNGTTWLDRTNYYQLFQASDENLEWALQMEADRMVNSFIAKKDLDSEMTVVRNEYESGENQPFQVMIKRMQSVAYDWHNYGNSTIGNRSDIENVKIENLQAFYRQYYQPDNAVLLVAGKFDEAKVIGWVGKYFGTIAKPTRALPKLWTVEPTQDGERQFFVRRKGDIQIVMFGYKVPSNLHPDKSVVDFVNFVLTDSPTGRLHKALVETGKAAQVFGFPYPGADGGLHLIAAIVKKGEPVEPVQAEMTKIVEEFFKNPPSPEEMERVRKNAANSAERTLNNHEQIGLELSEFISLGDWRLFFKDRDDAQMVTVDQVKTAAAKYYKRDNRVVGIFQPEDNPQRAEIPAPPTAAEVLKDFKGKQTVSNAEAFDPSQANIDKRTKRVDVGGIKVSLLTKKNKGEQVNFSVRFRSGDEKSLFGQATVAAMTGQMLSRGTSKFTRAQLADELEKLKIAGGINGLSASGQTTRPNVVAAIKLAAHVMREPSFPESEFEQLKKQTLTGLESQKSDPQALASVMLGKHFNTFPKGDVRYSNSIEEAEADTKAVTLEQVRAFHKKFYAAEKGEIAIVGDFDEAEVLKAIRESFADWTGGVPYVRLSSPYKDIAPVNRSIETPDKENSMFLARININMQDTDPDYPALLIANYIMGQSGFDSRLTSRIRVKDGLSYGAGSRLNVGSTDRGASWSGFAISAPQNTEKVELAFKDEVNKAIKDGFTLVEVVAAKSGVLQQRLQSRAQDGSLAGGLASNAYLGRTYAFSAALEAKIEALKAEDVSAVFRKYIDPSKITFIKAGDFAKVAKQAAAGDVKK